MVVEFDCSLHAIKLLYCRPNLLPNHAGANRDIFLDQTPKWIVYNVPLSSSPDF